MSNNKLASKPRRPEGLTEDKSCENCGLRGDDGFTCHRGSKTCNSNEAWQPKGNPLSVLTREYSTSASTDAPKQANDTEVLDTNDILYAIEKYGNMLNLESIARASCDKLYELERNKSDTEGKPIEELSRYFKGTHIDKTDELIIKINELVKAVNDLKGGGNERQR